MRQTDLVELIYSSAISRGQLDAPVEKIAQIFPDIRFTIQAQCVAKNKYYHTSFFNFDEGFAEDFSEVASLNPLPKTIISTPMQRIGRSVSVFPTEFIERTDFFHGCLRERDQLNRGSGLIMHRDGTDAAFVAANIPKRFPDADEARLNGLLEELRPHFQSAFRLLLELNSRRNFEDSEGFWLGQIPAAALVVNDECSVRQMNGRAESLMARHASLFVGKRCQLSSSHRSHQATLKDLVKKATLSNLPVGPIALAAQGGPATLVFAVPVPSPVNAPSFVEPFIASQEDILLIVLDPSDVPAHKTEELRRLLGVSEREGEIVSHLVEGSSLREAADSLGITYNTARNHISNATSKSGLRSQADIVRIASACLARLPNNLDDPG